jgi:2,4-dienoyl-CoA reductase-like NADH-dependent reductase (Old Yellow Enzyme family)
MHLFSPLEIRGLTFRNRIAVSPMCEYSCEDGFANDWHMVHLGSRAVGGAALVLTEATAVEERGQISPADLGIWKDAHIEPLARIAAFIRAHGAVPGIQLAHAGRKASTSEPWRNAGALILPENGGWTPVAPSPIPFRESEPAPLELTRAQIAEIVDAFEKAATRAQAAGFQVVEIHAAHGYLLDEFLSPLANHRTDEYGGSFENRIRIVLEVVAAIRKVWPDSLPLFMRISATDWVEGGWEIGDSIELARRVKPLGVDLIDCSSGGMVPHAKISPAPGFQVPFAEQIRRETGISTGAVGMITEPEQADKIIAGGQADMVLLARELLRDPYWPRRAAKVLGATVQPPVQYQRAWSISYGDFTCGDRRHREPRRALRHYEPPRDHRRDIRIHRDTRHGNRRDSRHHRSSPRNTDTHRGSCNTGYRRRNIRMDTDTPGMPDKRRAPLRRFLCRRGHVPAPAEPGSELKEPVTLLKEFQIVSA